MNGWRATWLVARRELRVRFRSRAYRIGTAALMAAVVAAIVLPSVFADEGPSRATVGSVQLLPAEVRGAIVAAAAPIDLRIRFEPIGAGEEGQALRDGEVDAVLDLTGPRPVVTAEDELDVDLELALRQALQRVRLTDALARTGLSPSDLDRLLAPVPLEVRSRQGAQPERSTNEVTAFIGVVVIFTVLIYFGQFVATGVVEEKGSRVIELLLAAARPRTLLSGKVLGIGLTGLVQVLSVAAAAAVAAVVTQQGDLPRGSVLTVVGLVMWFVLGYVLYAWGYAAAGSLVTRQEEVQSATAPVWALLTLGYFLAIVAGGSESVVVQVASFLPPFAPLVMPVRAATGDAAAWEVAVAAVLTLAMTLLLARLAARVYAGSALRFGERVGFRHALAMARDRRQVPEPVSSGH